MGHPVYTTTTKQTYADNPFHRLKKSLTDISAETEHFVKKIGSCSNNCWGDEPALKTNKVQCCYYLYRAKCSYTS